MHCSVSHFLLEGAVIGSVNPQLYALGASTRSMEGSHGTYQDQLKLEEWMRNYVNVLCINSWQVKRYIDIFSASSLIGFSSEDVSRITDLYAKADNNWSSSIKNLLVSKDESQDTSIEALKSQILYYHHFLSVVAEVARSKWTEFNLKMMSIGLGTMVISLFIHFLAIKRVNKSFGNLISSSEDSGMSFGWIFASFIVMIRASSFLSNSYILEEGKVANFLLATTAFVMLRYSILKKKMTLEAIIFILLMVVLRVTIDVGLSKQAVTSQFMSVSPSWLLGINLSHPVWTSMTELLPMLALIGLAYLLYRTVSSSPSWGIPKYVVSGTIISYFLIALHWVSESDILDGSFVLKWVPKNYVPWTVYAIGSGQLLFLAIDCMFIKNKTSNGAVNFFVKMVAMLSACSSTIIILSGKQGPVFALASVLAGYCIMRLEVLCQDNTHGADGVSSLNPLPVVQWSLLAVCLFFATGHWCAFDGLRYGAAFIGFDEFVLVRQAILLTVETFGFSHILALFGLPILVGYQYLFRQAEQKNSILAARLIQAFMIYGLITATTTTATILCVTIQRRHLMVWGLFAPKFVFDVVGLILNDVLTCLASVYYLNGLEDNTTH